MSLEITPPDTAVTSATLSPLDTIHTRFAGRMVILGFGSIGQGVLPLVLRHVEMPRDRITIVTAQPRGAEVAAEYGITFI